MVSHPEGGHAILPPLSDENGAIGLQQVVVTLAGSRKLLSKACSSLYRWFRATVFQISGWAAAHTERTTAVGAPGAATRRWLAQGRCGCWGGHVRAGGGARGGGIAPAVAIADPGEVAVGGSQ